MRQLERDSLDKEEIRMSRSIRLTASNNPVTTYKLNGEDSTQKVFHRLLGAAAELGAQVLRRSRAVPVGGLGPRHEDGNLAPLRRHARVEHLMLRSLELRGRLLVLSEER